APGAGHWRARERAAAAPDARLVDVLAGPGVGDLQDPVVVHRVQQAPIKEWRRSVGREAGQEPAHQIAAGGVLGGRDVACSPGPDREEGAQVLALGAGTGEEQALASDGRGCRLRDVLEAPELAAVGVVADHEPSADRDDLRPETVLPDER